MVVNVLNCAELCRAVPKRLRPRNVPKRAVSAQSGPASAHFVRPAQPDPPSPKYSRKDKFPRLDEINLPVRRDVRLLISAAVQLYRSSSYVDQASDLAVPFAKQAQQIRLERPTIGTGEV